MKKSAALIMAVLLVLLTACGTSVSDTSSVAHKEETARFTRLEYDQATDICFVGDNLLVFSGLTPENQKLTLYNLAGAVQAEYPLAGKDATGRVYVRPSGDIYIVFNDSIVCLDSGLKVRRTCDISALGFDMSTLVSPVGDTLYYCDSDNFRIRSVDLTDSSVETVIDFDGEWYPIGLYALGGELLTAEVNMVEENSSRGAKLLISDGKIVEDTVLDTTWYGDGDVEVKSVSSRFSSSFDTSYKQEFSYVQEYSEPYVSSDVRTVVTHSDALENDTGSRLLLRAYRDGGFLTSEVIGDGNDYCNVSENNMASNRCSFDTSGRYCVVTAYCGADFLFYLWDLSSEKVADESALSSKLIETTRSDATKESVEKKYGVELMYGTGDGEVGGVKYVDIFKDGSDSDYLSEVIALFDYAMSRYPDNFFRDTAINKPTRIYLCGTLSGETNSITATGFCSSTGSRHNLFINVENGYYGYFSLDEIGIFSTINHEITHSVDAYIAQMSFNLDSNVWMKLQPEGFGYNYNYAGYSGESNDKYILDFGKKDEVYFADSYSQVNELEDRARLMEFAMMEGEQPLFDCPHARAKLTYFASVIRKTVGKNWTGEAVWEKYCDL